MEDLEKALNKVDTGFFLELKVKRNKNFEL